MSQRSLDALHRLVCPGFDRDRLPPTLDSVFIGQSHHDRRAHRRLEELEFADQFVIESADFNARYCDHCSLERFPVAPSPRMPSMTQRRFSFIIFGRSKGLRRGSARTIAFQTQLFTVAHPNSQFETCTSTNGRSACACPFGSAWSRSPRRRRFSYAHALSFPMAAHIGERRRRCSCPSGSTRTSRSPMRRISS